MSISEQEKNYLKAYWEIISDEGFDKITSATDQEGIKIYAFFDKIAKQRYTVKDTNISTRVFKHWKDKGLLPRKDTSGWTKLSIIELLWIRIIEVMRVFNFPLDKMVVVKDHLFRRLDDNVPPLMKNFYESLDLGISRCLFGYALLQMLMEKMPLFIVVDQNGTTRIVNPEEFNPTIPVISIPLISIINDFIEDEQIMSLYKETKYFSSKEMHVIRLLRQKRYDRITLRFDDNKEVKLAELEEKSKVEMAAKLQEVISNRKHVRVEASRHDQDEMHVVLTTKEKII